MTRKPDIIEMTTTAIMLARFITSDFVAEAALIAWIHIGSKKVSLGDHGAVVDSTPVVNGDIVYIIKCNIKPD